MQATQLNKQIERLTRRRDQLIKAAESESTSDDDMPLSAGEDWEQGDSNITPARYESKTESDISSSSRGITDRSRSTRPVNSKRFEFGSEVMMPRGARPRSGGHRSTISRDSRPEVDMSTDLEGSESHPERAQSVACSAPYRYEYQVSTPYPSEGGSGNGRSEDEDPLDFGDLEHSSGPMTPHSMTKSDRASPMNRMNIWEVKPDSVFALNNESYGLDAYPGPYGF